MTESSFFQDISCLTAVAGLVSLVFARLKWPKVIGYLAAGILMSSHTWGGSFLVDESSVRTIGQLGVVFLMFSLGLGFSMPEINKLKGAVLPAAILDTLLMTSLGYMLARNVFGWAPVPSLFLGVAICDSATTLLAKMLGELGWSNRPFVRSVMGISLCEDIICVGLVALVTAFAHGNGLSLGLAGARLGALGVFFLATFAFGVLLMPRLLKSSSRSGDDETMLITLLGSCFFVSYIAYRCDFSLALGAFMVGFVCSVSEYRHRIAELIEPLKALFAAIFFVSVGLLVDPVACWRNLPAILMVSTLVVVGKFFNITLGSILFGVRLKTAVVTGITLAQIGEFAFMVAILCASTPGCAQLPIYDIVVAVSLLTTLLNSLLVKVSERWGEAAENVLPSKFASVLKSYGALVERLRTGDKQATVTLCIRRETMVLIVIGSLNVAVAVACSVLGALDWRMFSDFFDLHKRFFFALFFNLFMVSMLAPVINAARQLGAALVEALSLKSNEMWQTALAHTVRLFVTVGVVALWFLQLTMTNVNLAPSEPWARRAIAVVILLAALFGWKYFLKNAHNAAERIHLAISKSPQELNPLPAADIVRNYLHELILSKDSVAVGCTLAGLAVRAKTGASVIRLERDGKVLCNPPSDFKLEVGDKLVIYADEVAFDAAEKLLAKHRV